MIEENQRQYELTFLVSPELEEEKVLLLEKEVLEDIKKIEGIVKISPIKDKKLEKRQLSYPIKKFQFAYFISFDLTLEPSKVKELTSIIKEKKDIIRHLITIAIQKRIAPVPKKGIESITKDFNKPIGKIKSKLEIPKKPIKKTTEEKRRAKVELKEIDKKLEEILE